MYQLPVLRITNPVCKEFYFLGVKGVKRSYKELKTIVFSSHLEVLRGKTYVLYLPLTSLTPLTSLLKLHRHNLLVLGSEKVIDVLDHLVVNLLKVGLGILL